MSVREAFANAFGEDQAAAVEAAANEHANGYNSENKGSDPFKWALLMAIGYECTSKDSYRDYHGITAPWGEVKAWMIEHGELGSHDGDSDVLSLLAGVYDEYVKPV